MTHATVTVRTPGRPTEHRPLREGELDEWLVTLDAGLVPEERDALLDWVGSLAAVG